MKITFLLYFNIIVAAHLFFSCASAPKFTSNDPYVVTNNKVSQKAKKANQKEKTEKIPEQPELYYNLTESLETDVGNASYYADDFDGKQTANGEVFNMYELTAAHKSYPFNTLLRVTNLSNNKTTIVRINDRGPFVDDRIIDLSLGAALQLDMIDTGIQKVQLDVIEWGEK